MASVLARFANLAFQGFVETGTNVFGQFHRTIVAENPNGQLRLAHNDRTAFAFAEMLFEFDTDRGFEFAVEVIRDLANSAGAVQFGFLSRRKRSSFWRNFKRARSSRDFTAGTEIPIAAAVSSVESSSMSRRTKTVRKSESS